MDSQMKLAIIGVIGTLAGTVLGWMLNNLSQKGRINAYVALFEEKFEFLDEMGCMAISNCIEQTESYSYNLVLDLYNSSEKTKIVRNLCVVYSDGKNILHRSIPYDNETRRNSGPVSFFDEICPFNIPPKTIIELNLHNGVHLTKDGSDFIWKVKKIYVTYIDEKDKQKKIPIKSEAYCNIFDQKERE